MPHDLQARIDAAIELAVRYGGIDGAHHKTWVIDQMVRCLMGCKKNNRDSYGENDAYCQLVSDACAGLDGPHTYDWDVGIPP